jgi:hypothetical protein
MVLVGGFFFPQNTFTHWVNGGLGCFPLSFAAIIQLSRRL